MLINKKNIRIKKITKEIKKNISIILIKNIKDPRIKSATISNIYISNDFSYLNIFITFLNNNNYYECKKKIFIMQNAANFFSKILKKNMYLRLIPKIKFIYDHTIIKNINLYNKITKIFKFKKN
ncbi:MAG: 30S ribosome-binding factor RbfA [Candidatus Makana argininalis]